jgi:RNA recognition motif-containing protein
MSLIFNLNAMQLFLENLPLIVTERDIYNLLSRYGLVIKIKILRNIRGKSLCKALVNIKASIDTKFILDTLQNANFKQQFLIAYELKEQKYD